jgi:uncharacterized protein (DUF1810 family)
MHSQASSHVPVRLARKKAAGVLDMLAMMPGCPGRSCDGVPRIVDPQAGNHHNRESAVMEDRDDLERFVQAQRPVYRRVLEELAAGHKRTHWMWYVFPQLRGLGSSAIARTYGLASLAEARAYLAHPLLGANLRECAQLLLAGASDDARAVLGYPDDLKLRSCMTLFAQAAGTAADRALFRAVLAKFFAGAADPLTLGLLTSASGT